MLRKRTPGAPLSDAEIEQRREAARARWAKWGAAGAAAGAVAGAALSEAATRELRTRWEKGAIRSARRWRDAGRRAKADAAAADTDLTEAGDALARARRRGAPPKSLIEQERAATRRFAQANRLAEMAMRRGDPRPMAQWSLEEANDIDRGRPRRLWERAQRIQTLTPTGIRTALRRSRLKFIPAGRLGRAAAIGATAGGLLSGGAAWLGKRTPGAPLSDAELQQRRDAARARWRDAAEGAAAGGAAAAAVAGAAQVTLRGVAAVRAGRALARGKAEAAAEMADTDRKLGLIDRVAAGMRGRAAARWPTDAYGQHLGNVVRRRRAEERRMDAGQPLSSGFGHPEEISERYRAYFAGETGEIAEARGKVGDAPKPKRVTVQGHTKTNRQGEVLQSRRHVTDPLDDPDTRRAFEARLQDRVDAGEDPVRAERELRREKGFKLRRGRHQIMRRQTVGQQREVGTYRRRVLPAWPTTADFDRWRPEMLEDIRRRAGDLRSRVDRQGWEAAQAARRAGREAARSILAARPRLSGRNAALAGAAGAALGYGTTLVREKLGKAHQSAPHCTTLQQRDATLGKAATVAEAAAATADPSPAQAKAGNYRKGRVTLHGMPIVIETPAGGWRRGIAANGRPWATKMPGHYGYVGRTKGADGDQVDVMIGPSADDAALPVWVIDQFNPSTDAFDEHKAYLGWPSRTAAIAAYDASFSDGSGPRRRRGVTRLSLADFRAWAHSEPDEPLAKISPDDGFVDREPEPEAVPASTSEVARRLSETFRVWMLQPGKALEGEGLAEALRPLREQFVRAGIQVMDPPPLPGEPGGGEGRRFLAVDLSSRNPRVEVFARRYELDRIRAITADQRAAIRQVIVDGTMQGLPVEEQARRLRESIGLSPGQARWVQNYRAELVAGDYASAMARALRDARHDRVLNRAMERQEALSAEQVDKMVASYQRRVLAYRAMTIARTEGLRAATHGQLAGSRVFLEENPGLDVVKTWIATDDDRTRDAHRDLDREQVVGIDTPFTWKDPATGREAQIRWPHDPDAPADQVINCRCSIGLRMIPKERAGRFTATPVEPPNP